VRHPRQRDQQRRQQRGLGAERRLAQTSAWPAPPGAGEIAARVGEVGDRQRGAGEGNVVGAETAGTDGERGVQPGIRRA